jgi:hypothetical protein
MSLGFFLLAPEAGQLSNVSLTIKNVTADGVVVRYQGLSGNMPLTYKNSVALWNSLIPNVGAPGQPLETTEIPTNDQPGSVFVEYPIVDTDYCLTYQVGESQTTMCALAPHSSTMADLPTSIDIDIDDVTTNSVRVYYSTLPGYLPKSYNNWIGIWQGYAIPYRAPDFLASSPIPSDATEGYATLQNVSISSDFTYTVIYFCGASRFEAAAVKYFQPQS